MEDKAIIDLFLQENGEAAERAAAKYGAYCTAVAGNVLGASEDVESTLRAVWQTARTEIPSCQPSCLRTYLGRVTRTLAFLRYRQFRTRKRYGSMVSLLTELEDCVPDPDRVKNLPKRLELTRVLQQWVDGLSPADRRLFVRRYWYCVSVSRLAGEAGVSQGRISRRLARLRRHLRARLEREGVDL